MLKYKETDKKGETTKFSWVTDLPLNRNSVMPVPLAAADGPLRTSAIVNTTLIPR